MSGRIVWDQVGEKKFETGVDHVVLYPAVAGAYPKGVAWNGVTAITETPSGAEPEAVWADGIKYLSLQSAPEFGATLETLTYPDEWSQCDGSPEAMPGLRVGGQSRKSFGLSYRTLIGNDVDQQDHGYKLHLLYGALANLSESAYTTLGETPEPVAFSYELTTTPVQVPGFKPTAILTIDSTVMDAAKMLLLEALLYGKDATTEPVAAAVDGYLPLPAEVFTLLGVAQG